MQDELNKIEKKIYDIVLQINEKQCLIDKQSLTHFTLRYIYLTRKKIFH